MARIENKTIATSMRFDPTTHRKLQLLAALLDQSITDIFNAVALAGIEELFKTGMTATQKAAWPAMVKALEEEK